MTAVLKATNVVVRYGRAIAVEDASITATQGAITAIVGPNGAGKSSLLLAIVGAVSAASASIILDGQAIDALDATKRVRAGVVLVPQGRQIFPRLSVRDNLQVIADALALPGGAVPEALQRFPILEERQLLAAGILSGGEQQMLALARALMTHPKVLLLDEPTLGLAPAKVSEVMAMVMQFAQSGIAVVIVEPSIHLIRSRTDRGYVMLRGRVIAEAQSAADLETQYLQHMGIGASVGAAGAKG